MSTQNNNTQDIKQDDKTEQTNKMIYIYQNIFVSSVLSIVDSVKKISLENKDNIPAEKKNSHENLCKTCEDIVNQYKNQTSDVDQVKIIKKVFKVLTQHKDLVKNHDFSLFTVRTPEGKIMTLIPGLNINLVVPFLTEEQKLSLWENIESMFTTSVKMVYLMTDESRHSKDILEIVGEFEKKIVGKFKNNFFMGLNAKEGGENAISMDQLMSNDIIIPGTEAKSGILGSLGVDKLMDVNNLTNEIKKFDENDINDTISTLTSMLGNDNDIKDVCSTMVKSVLDDIKTNGIENMFSIAERVSSKIGNKIDPEKMAKTASGMNNLIKNNGDKLKDMKDENGKPIGEDFLKQFEGTFNMAKMFQAMGK
jgi:hypothetical protein